MEASNTFNSIQRIIPSELILELAKSGNVLLGVHDKSSGCQSSAEDS